MMDSPLDIAQAFGEWVKPLPEQAAQRAWVFTSATLGDDPQLSWFTEPCGLQQARCMQVGSPFDYERQAGLFVPPDMVRPQDARHSEQVAFWAEQGARALRGRTLVLTTTLSAMRTIGEVLRTRLSDDSGLEVLVQGEWPKRKLMERFRQAIELGDKGLVLVGSASFWEGFDVPGEALQLVVIDKLPFPPPGDPLVQARSERLEAQGKSPFADHALPEAAVALKQGAGRLIRSELDHGILLIGDPRLVQMSYGKRLMRALPPMRRLLDAQAFEAALQEVTRSSTTSSWT
jgi:ATP-dependent DNA helicase DinG